MEEKNEFVSVWNFANYIDAHILLGRLEAEGIVCWLKDEYTVTIDPLLTNAIGGIKLMVPVLQAERAAGLIHDFLLQNRTSCCPRCKSDNIEFISTPRKAGNWLSVLLGGIIGNYALPVNKTWHCFACGHEFETPVIKEVELEKDEQLREDE